MSRRDPGNPDPANRRLRALGLPRSAVVRTGPDGEPAYVRLPGRPARRVRAIRESWRIDDEWWRRPISREYRAVVLDDGRLLTLYHDLLEGRWYVQKEES